MDLKVEINGNLLPDDGTVKVNDRHTQVWTMKRKKNNGGNRHRKYICTHISVALSWASELDGARLGDRKRRQMSQPFNIVDVWHLRLFLHDDGVESTLPADYQNVSVEWRRERMENEGQTRQWGAGKVW